MIAFSAFKNNCDSVQLARPEFILVQDHHYDETDRNFPLQDLLDNSLCDPLDHVVIFDHVLQHQDVLQSYNLLCLPIFVANTCRDFVAAHITPDWKNKTHTFNFMINKPRLNRDFLLLLVSYFELKNYAHTLCWKQSNFDRATLRQKTDNQHYQNVIESTAQSVPTRSFLTQHENLVLDRGLKYGTARNHDNYKNFLQKNIFEPSCVSLITEPGFYERETIITEKTIMAMWGGTIPIWVGGWRIPDYLRDLGFDLFDDVVDHSYQDLPDPWDRCYYAVTKNLDLLQDFDQVKNIIDHSQDRLAKNLQLLKSDLFRRTIMEKIQPYSSCQDLYNGVVRAVNQSLTPALKYHD